jgi:hypothetical protein
MDPLEAALSANREAVQRELAAAENELEELRTRVRELERLIRRARYALDLDELPAPRIERKGDSAMTLHDALVVVLTERSNAAMTAQELADAVSSSGLYQKRDGSSVDPAQIHARVHNYGRLFVREGGRIRLREVPTESHDPALLARWDSAMQEVYDAAMREVRYPARRFLDMLRRTGGLVAAKHLLAKPGVSEGFRRLAEARKLDLTMEYQALRPEYAGLFREDEREVARDRLLGAGMPPSDLPDRLS